MPRFDLHGGVIGVVQASAVVLRADAIVSARK